MTKTLLTTISVFAFAGLVNAQSISYTNCDNWGVKDDHDTLAGFDSGFDALATPVIATFKDDAVKSEGTYSARVESFITQGYHLPGIFGSKLDGEDYGNASYTMYYRLQGVGALISTSTHATPVAEVPTSVSLMVKTEGELGDSALINFSFTKFDEAGGSNTTVGSCQQRIALEQGAVGFTKVTIPYTALVDGAIPDSLGFVMINSMNIYQTVDANLPIAKMWVDDMRINYGSSGITFDHLAKKSPVAVYPNPAVGSTQVQANPSEVSYIEIFNAAGAKVKTLEIKADETRIDLQEFSSGAYLIKAVDKYGAVYHNGRSLIVK